MPDKLTVLSEISIELLVNELARRARAKNMTVDELWNAARDNWASAEQSADDLLQRGHEGETKSEN